MSGLLRNLRIEISAGDDLRVFVSVEDQNGNPVDILEAQSIRWWAARTVNGPPVIQKSLDDGVTINAPTEFYFDIESSESAPLSRAYYFEAEVITDEGLTYTVQSGTMFVYPSLIPSGASQ